MRAFVTGASGFIGGHLIEALLKRGFKVRALVHRRALSIEDKVESVTGDICDRGLLAEALRGADTLFHLASALGASTIGTKEFRRINALGTQTVLEAARSAGVGRAVHLSSAGVLGSVRMGDFATESYPPKPITPYDVTKLEGEEIALRFSREGLDVVLVRPGWAYGPGDRRTFKLIRSICRGHFVMATRGNSFQTPVYIDDLVDGILLAREKGRKGEIYHLAGGVIMPVQSMAEDIASACGKTLPRVYIPAPAARLAAFLLDAAYYPLRREPPLGRSKLSFFLHSKPLVIDKARRELGFAPEVDFHKGIQRAVSWYKGQGWLPPARIRN